MANDKTGLLLVNLGTPEQPTAAAIRRWLKEFLLDRRVVQLPRLIWLPILYCFILPFRPRRLADTYKEIWLEQGSPLMVISERQKAALAGALKNDHVQVELAMRYGQPAIAPALQDLSMRGVEKILIFPLYPQYSHTTTGSVKDAVNHAMQETDLPPVDGIDDYHDDPGYIEALANRVQRFREQHGPGDKLLISWHGIPQAYVEQGDPYADQCETTTRLLTEKLALSEDDWFMSYQSRLGKAPWLQPYTDKTLEAWGQAGKIKVIDVICPGFSADCLETLEEINIQNRELFRRAGGVDLRYIPALNDDPEHIEALANIVRKRLNAPA